MNAMVGEAGFIDPGQQALCDRFLADGPVVVPVADADALDRLRQAVADAAARHLGVPMPADVGGFLDGIHGHVAADRLNALRLAAIGHVNALPWARAAYYRMARAALDAIVGNELAMQRRLNLSIQLPNDDSSLLAVHADVWDGDSPFEVVAWLPLVDCFATKSMYLLPPQAGAGWEARMAEFQHDGVDVLYQAIEPDLVWCDVPYGTVMVFCQNLMHGNRVNLERTTRWSMNCRFKSLLSPYAGKALGEFFEPITPLPATRLALDYRLPGGFDE